MAKKTSGFLFPLPPLYTKSFEGCFDYAEPRQIGSFSLDGNRQFVPGNEQLKLIRPEWNSGDPKWDLNVGFDEAVEADFEEEGLESLLKWITLNPECLTPDVNFVTNRFVLKTIMVTPYNSKYAKWILYASKFRGAIYLRVALEEEQKKELSVNSSKPSYWNSKFEHYMTSDSQTWNEPANVNGALHGVVRSKLNDNIMVFSSRMGPLDHDCPPEYPEKTKRTDKYVTLKTLSPKTHNLKNIWAISALSGCSNNVIGMLDEEGIVQRIETYKTEDISIFDQKVWSSKVCMNVLDCFLMFLKDNIFEDNPKIVYVLKQRHRQKVFCERVEHGELKILPDWYIDSFPRG